MRQIMIFLAIGFALRAPAQTNTSAQEQQRQAQATEQRRLELQQQLQEAYKAQQQAKQQEAAAQAAAIQSQQQANQQQMEANKTASEAGMEQGMWSAASQNVTKRLQMVTTAVDKWQPPQGYTAKTGAVELADPFAAPVLASPKSKQLTEFLKAVENTCLAVDEAHGVAIVSADCSKRCKVVLQKDIYPLLPDGSPIESAEQVKMFFGACKNANEIMFLKADGTLTGAK